MMNIPRLILRGLVALLLLSSLPAVALTDAEAVNMSGLQRMLSQRTAKTWLMLGQNINVLEAREQRAQSVALFESNLQTLQAYAPSPQIGDALNQVQAMWKGYKVRVLATPDRNEAVKLLRQSDALLQLSENAVRLIQEHAGVPSAKLVNVSGRQRMLSQRIARLYLTKSWGLSYDTLEQDFQTALNDYDKGLNTLLTNPDNPSEIQEGLSRVSTLWKYSRAGFNLSERQVYVPTTICSTTDSLLKQMQAVTKLYEMDMQRLATR